MRKRLGLRHVDRSGAYERGYLAEQRRCIIATPKGAELYDALPDAAKYPDMTAIWHEQQKAISAGAYDLRSFIQELAAHIGKEIATLKHEGFKMQTGVPTCPSCAKSLRRIGKKGGNGFFWGCSGFEDGCKFTCSDKAGQPSQARSFRRRSRRRPEGRRIPARPRASSSP